MPTTDTQLSLLLQCIARFFNAFFKRDLKNHEAQNVINVNLCFRIERDEL